MTFQFPVIFIPLGSWWFWDRKSEKSFWIKDNTYIHSHVLDFAAVVSHNHKGAKIFIGHTE